MHTNQNFHWNRHWKSICIWSASTSMFCSFAVETKSIISSPHEWLWDDVINVIREGEWWLLLQPPCEPTIWSWHRFGSGWVQSSFVLLTNKLNGVFFSYCCVFHTVSQWDAVVTDPIQQTRHHGCENLHEIWHLHRIYEHSSPVTWYNPQCNQHPDLKDSQL